MKNMASKKKNEHIHTHASTKILKYEICFGGMKWNEMICNKIH